MWGERVREGVRGKGGLWKRSLHVLPANLDAKVAADGAGERVVGAGLAEELAARADGVVALPHLERGEGGGET